MGMGITGLETARFMLRKGLSFMTTDAKEIDHLDEEVKSLLKKGVIFKAEKHSEKAIEWADTIVLSPGISLNHPLLKKATKQGKDVISEIELAFSYIKKPIIAITGSNGKTTTATLVTEILKENGFKVFLGGNIGTPLITIADQDEDYDYLVVEVSSFQLQGTKEFRPYIASILNISPNHLDHHSNLKEYIESKLKIFSNQKKEDWATLNNDDHLLKKLLGNLSQKVITLGKNSDSHIHFSNGSIITSNYKYSLENFKPKGIHNIYNAMTAIAISEIVSCDPSNTQKKLDEFTPPPFRLEYIGKRRGVVFYNDSKSTTPHSTLKAIQSIDPPLILIMGGKDKGLDYSILKKEIQKKVKHLVLYGEASSKLSKHLALENRTFIAKNLSDATKKAVSVAKEGDSILFSPGCSSFDMFSSYIERGKEFTKIVELL